MIKYLVTVEEENGELILPIPDGLLSKMGWEVGDVLVWEETEMWEDHGEYPGYTLRKGYDNEN